MASTLLELDLKENTNLTNIELDGFSGRRKGPLPVSSGETIKSSRSGETENDSAGISRIVVEVLGSEDSFDEFCRVMFVVVGAVRDARMQQRKQAVTVAVAK